jgi:Zinc carboxypeptidase
VVTRRFLLAASVALLALGVAAPAGAVNIAPPWCGTPEPDAAGALPDGTQPTDPVGSFPHIPYYAIGCTLDAIKRESIGGRMSVRVFGHSAQGRPMYLVTINARRTGAQRRDYARWQHIRHNALDDPARAQRDLDRYRDDVKVPIFIQSGIHGNEYEGVDAMMLLINKLATTPPGADAEVDRILDHAVVVFNTDQNPDGRAIGQRANGNGFDLNRDFLTQSQPETQATAAVMQQWLFPDMLDQHGYETPTLVEATTKPHNPGIDYDLWLKWNQPRTAANGAALAAQGLGIQRPVNDWCSNGDLPPIGSATCPDGTAPGPAVAEGWDDWGPFYTPMYNQLVGLDGSTVEMCQSLNTDPSTQRVCGAPGATDFPRGRLAARLAQYTVATSTLAFDIPRRHDLLRDELEIYRRADAGEARAPCCPPPFDVANNWMHEYPTAYVIPMGAGQRSDAEANRLVEWLLTNGIEVSQLRRPATFGSQTFAEGSYVVWMDQAHRGLADTALGIGVDVSSAIGQLYAPPGAWSHGYLWGADVVTIPTGTAFAASTRPISRPQRLRGGVEGTGDDYVLAIDSATAVRTLNALLAGGVPAQRALASFGSHPAGSAIFAGDAATRRALDRAGRDSGLIFQAVAGSALPALEPIGSAPRIAVLAAGPTQELWVMRNLGFTADFVPTGTTSDLNNPSAPDPLAGYDVVFNQSPWPSGATAQARLTAFFARHGGYLGAGTNGANFLAAAGQVAGLTAANRGGAGRSGIVYWDNTGGAESPIVGAYPSRDTAIMDPPTWFTAVPGGLSVDARLPATGFFAAGLWLLDAQSASAPGSALIAHGPNDAGTARLTVFAMNPLYRADPEREWPAFAAAAYWVHQEAASTTARAEQAPEAPVQQAAPAVRP